MQNTASTTALTAAAARAAHLIVDAEPRVFADTLAADLLGERADELLDYHRNHSTHPVLAGARVQVLLRSRITEQVLADTGIGQYALLGAGLDSFAYRSPLAATTHVVELDHPATQSYKRDRLAQLDRSPAGRITYVAADLEREPAAGALARTDLDPTAPTLVSWLGVTMYLTRDAIDATLASLSGLAPGSRIVLDTMLPPELRDAAGQAYVDAVGAMTAERGEPWLTFLDPDDLAGLLARHGYRVGRSLDQRAALPEELWRRGDALRPSSLTMITHAIRA